MAGGKITYNGIDINFPRKWNRFDVSNAVKNSAMQAASGIKETLHFFDQDFIVAEKQLETGQIQNEIEQFYAYARDGSTFSIEEDRNLGAYIPFEGKSLNTNDETAGTLTRAHTSPTNDDTVWYLDPSTGLMTVIDAANTPAFPAGRYGSGVQIRGAATNLITNRISNAAWTKTNMTAVATSETLDPAGGTNADKLTATAANGQARFQTATAPGNNIANGFWLKSPSGNVACTLFLDAFSSGSASQAITVTPQWQRFSMSADSTAWTGNIGTILRINTNTEAIYSWFTPQLFDNTEFDLGTVGPLSTSSKTRIAEQGAEYSSTNIMPKEQGTIAGWFIPDFGFALAPASLLFSCADDSTTTTRHSQIEITAAGALRAVLRRNNDGTSAVDLTASLSGLITAGQAHQFGLTWDVTISNGVKLWWDGVQIGSTSSNNPFNISDVGTTISIGGLVSSNGFPAWGVIDDIVIFKEVKDATWFNHYFNKGRGYGVRRNRWSSVRLTNPNNSPVRRVGDRVDLRLEVEEVIS